MTDSVEGPRNILVLPKPLKMGGGQFEVDLTHVESLAARGMTLEQIALALGISDKTLRTRRREFAEFSDAIQRGKSKGIANVTGKLMEAVNSGDVKAMTLYLKCQAQWKETVVQEQTGEVKVTITRRVVREPLDDKN
jgi:hypothetical protein